MFNSYIGTVMTMKCDIYIQQNTQSESGIMQRKWVYSKTIPCRIDSLKSQGSNNRGDSKSFESSGRDEYLESLQITVKSPVAMSKRWRVSSIRSNKNEQMFKELDLLNNPDTIFEVMASHPIMDPFGNVSYYEISLMRVPVQNNDTNRI